MKFLVLNGPNLNLLGSREPQKYGSCTLSELEQRLVALGSELQVGVACAQYNGEGALVDAVHAAARDGYDGIILNAGAYTHTSVALRDALLGTAMAFAEVHITNVHARESFRQHSYLSDIAEGVLCGFGVRGYELALMGMAAARRQAAEG